MTTLVTGLQLSGDWRGARAGAAGPAESRAHVAQMLLLLAVCLWGAAGGNMQASPVPPAERACAFARCRQLMDVPGRLMLRGRERRAAKARRAQQHVAGPEREAAARLRCAYAAEQTARAATMRTALRTR